MTSYIHHRKNGFFVANARFSTLVDFVLQVAGENAASDEERAFVERFERWTRQTLTAATTRVPGPSNPDCLMAYPGARCGPLVALLLLRSSSLWHHGGGTMKNENLEGKQSGGIVIPALLWWAGVPLIGVILLWALFFRG